MNRSAVLDAAQKAVCERPSAHGAPEQTFDRIAARWNVHIINAYPDAVTRPNLLTASDVAVMLIDMKLARLEGNPKHADSWIDAAGYAACGGEVSGAEPSAPKVELALRPVAPGPQRIFGHTYSERF